LNGDPDSITLSLPVRRSGARQEQQTDMTKSFQCSFLAFVVACAAPPDPPAAVGPTAPAETPPAEVPDPPAESPEGPTVPDTEPDEPPGCASGTEWEGGNHGSSLMHPGVDCLTCHQNGEAPHFTVAGTVMGALRDVDDCNGVEGVTVRITGADGDTFELVTNAAGNFHTGRAVALPYRAEVERDGVIAEMSAAQADGGCNACHTTFGSYGAPGRVIAPE
jgi:hypothetical protein